MHRMEADRLRPLSSDYAVRRDGVQVAMLSLARLWRRGEFEADGVKYTVRREGLLRRAVVLEREGGPALRAERRGLLPIQYEIRTDRTLTLRARWPTRTYVLLQGEQELATIRPKHLLARSAVADFSQELPLTTEIFIIALVLLRWRARARNAS